MAFYVEPIQQPSKSLPVDFSHLVCRLRPFETMFLKTLDPQAKSVSVPIQNLDDRPASIAEHKQVSGEHLMLEMVLHQDGQPVDLFPHVGMTQGQEHPASLGNRQLHLHTVSRFMTTINPRPSKPGGIFNDHSPRSNTNGSSLGLTDSPSRTFTSTNFSFPPLFFDPLLSFFFQ